MKQSYERVFSHYGADWDYEKIELLPECRRETRHGLTYEYQKVRKKFLGLITYTKWVNKLDIKIYPAETVDYYTCDCGEEG